MFGVLAAATLGRGRSSPRRRRSDDGSEAIGRSTPPMVALEARRRQTPSRSAPSEEASTRPRRSSLPDRPAASSRRRGRPARRSHACGRRRGTSAARLARRPVLERDAAAPARSRRPRRGGPSGRSGRRSRPRARPQAPKASAVRISVPTLPGSATRQSASDGRPLLGCRQVGATVDADHTRRVRGRRDLGEQPRLDVLARDEQLDRLGAVAAATRSSPSQTKRPSFSRQRRSASLRTSFSFSLSREVITARRRRYRARAAFACSASLPNCSGSLTARSASTLRSSSTSAAFRPEMNWL